MRIVMIGAGYVGLVSGACFAELGHRVTCVDRDARKIALLKDGHVPIFEPDLEKLVVRNAAAGRIDFAAEPAGSVDQADAVFIAVGTPSRVNDGHTDLTYVYAAVREIAGLLKDGAVVITKSTVPVGTCDEVERQIHDSNPAVRVAVAANPEFLREGAAISDFMNPDRIIVGTQDDSARAVLMEIYRPLTAKGVPLMQSMKSLILQSGSAPMSRMFHAALGWINASERSFCAPVLESAVRAFRRIHGRWCAPRMIMTCRCASSNR